jgi:HD-like signal output (HDOD) protein
MAAPSSIERLEPLPAIAVGLLDQIAAHTVEEASLLGLLEAQPELLAEISSVAMQATGSSDEATLDAPALLKQLSSLRLAEIAMTVLVGDYLRRAIRASDDDRYWRYILACAVCCEQVALPRQEDALLAYTAGLFHDIGRMALIAAYPNRYSNLLALTDRMFAANEPFDILEYERLLFGLDHFETATWVAGAWKLPAWLHAIIGKFDGQGMGNHAKLVATVRAGTSLAHSLGFGYLAAAPRGDIRKILSHCEDTQKHWKTSEDWEYAEESMRGKVRVCLRWYSANE